MSSSRYKVNKKRHLGISSSKLSMFQNALIGNVGSIIYGGRDALVWQYCCEHLSIEITIKLSYKVIDF